MKSSQKYKRGNEMKKIFTPVLTALIMVVVLVAVGIGKIKKKLGGDKE